MSESKGGHGPVRLWNQAVKAVKGDNAAQMIEAFTAEMTLIAEGLVEDQTKLRQTVDALERDHDRDEQSRQSALEAIGNDLREHQKDTERRLAELTRRLDAMEKQQSQKGRLLSAPWMDKLLILAGIVCGSWVLVTLLNLFH